MFVYYELIKPQLYTRINSKSKFLANYKYIYTARRYASTVYAVVLIAVLQKKLIGYKPVLYQNG